MRKACEKEHFVSRTFTEAESRQAGGSASKLAGSFAVKEAVAKVFGTGFRTFMPGDIEVLRDELGKPYVRLYGGALEQFEKMGMENHSGDRYSVYGINGTGRYGSGCRGRKGSKKG